MWDSRAAQHCSAMRGSMLVCLLALSFYPFIKSPSFNFIYFYHSYLKFSLTSCKLESGKSGQGGQLLPSVKVLWVSDGAGSAANNADLQP